MEHPGFSIIFKYDIEPRIRKITITAAEEKLLTDNPNSLQALGINKKIRAQALEELNFERQKELVYRAPNLKTKTGPTRHSVNFQVVLTDKIGP